VCVMTGWWAIAPPTPLAEYPSGLAYRCEGGIVPGKAGPPPPPPPARARLAAVASASNKKTLFQNVLASPAPYTAKWTPTATRPYFWNMALVRAA
jgi:hypothetical protein